MDDPLVDAIDIDEPAVHHIAESSTKNLFKGNKSRVTYGASSDTRTSDVRRPNGSETRAASAVVSVPDIEVRAFTSRQPSVGPFYASELENNVKCVVSTIIFLGVVAAIIIVAFYKNPGM